MFTRQGLKPGFDRGAVLMCLQLIQVSEVDDQSHDCRPSAEELLGHTAGWKISLEYIIIKFPCEQGLNYFQGSRDHGYSWVMVGQRYHRL